MGAFFVFSTLTIMRLVHQHQRIEEQKSARESLEAIQEDQADEPASPEETPSAKPPQMFAKAAKLLEQNPDLVGMVRYGDVSLYVCQSEDNSYYASHRFDGSEDPAGMIYMDCRGSIWPLSDNIILYGHNMRDGSRFGKLKRLAKQDYLNQYPTIRFASLYEMHDYAPVAIFYANVNPSAADFFDFASVNFPNADAFYAYIREIQTRSILDLNADVEYGTPLLTLATCSEFGVGDRLVVVCAQMEDVAG